MDVFKFNDARYRNATYSDGDKIRIDRLISFIGEGKTVLDLGCLDGFIGEQLLRRKNDVYGIDASESAVQKAKQRGIKAMVGNLEEPFQFAAQSFDAVLAGEIIEHIYDVDVFLSEINRVLKERGQLVLSTPNLAAFGRRILLLLNRNPHVEISYTGLAAGHIRYFIKSTLEGLLYKHGFIINGFTSDVINLNVSGSLALRKLASWFPSLGRSLIVRAQKC